VQSDRERGIGSDESLNVEQGIDANETHNVDKGVGANIERSIGGKRSVEEMAEWIEGIRRRE
jgi:hypothetical protein